MSWTIGAIEVLSLIVFVGFAVDYCLHLWSPQSVVSQALAAEERPRSHKYHSCHITDVEEKDEEEDLDEEEARQKRRAASIMILSGARAKDGGRTTTNFRQEQFFCRLRELPLKRVRKSV